MTCFLCPLALSIGQLCTDGLLFVWPSGGRPPLLVPPNTPFTYEVDGPVLEAHRVEHHVPIFRLSTDIVPGMPCSPSGGNATKYLMKK
jgi:hypothetical protein